MLLCVPLSLNTLKWVIPPKKLPNCSVSLLLHLSDGPTRGPLKTESLRATMYPPWAEATLPSTPSASSGSQLSCSEFDGLSCGTRVTFSGALMLNTAHRCHGWKLSELTVLSGAGAQIYILYSRSLQTFIFALILNLFSVNRPKSR